MASPIISKIPHRISLQEMTNFFSETNLAYFTFWFKIRRPFFQVLSTDTAAALWSVLKNIPHWTDNMYLVQSNFRLKFSPTRKWKSYGIFDTNNWRTSLKPFSWNLKGLRDLYVIWHTDSNAYLHYFLNFG